MQKMIDKEVSTITEVFDALTDEVIKGKNSDQLIHHLNGDSKNKLVIGSSGKGKSTRSNN